MHRHSGKGYLIATYNIYHYGIGVSGVNASNIFFIWSLIQLIITSNKIVMSKTLVNHRFKKLQKKLSSNISATFAGSPLNRIAINVV